MMASQIANNSPVNWCVRVNDYTRLKIILNGLAFPFANNFFCKCQNSVEIQLNSGDV